MNDRLPDLAGAGVPDRDRGVGRSIVSTETSASSRVRAPRWDFDGFSDDRVLLVIAAEEFAD